MLSLDLSNVSFSAHDIQSNITVPSHLSIDLCYETGLHIGDGHLSCLQRKNKQGSIYLVAYSGDFSNELDFYQKTVIPLLHRVYNKKTTARQSTKNTVQILMKSKAIATFKLNALQLPNGKKIGRIKIPAVIMEAGIEQRKACLRGIIDTDFSLVFRHGKYPKITGEVPSKNKSLVNQILSVFEELEIGHSCSTYKKYDKRNGNVSSFYKIDMNGEENLKKWMRHVGFKSSKHLTKLHVWKRFGVCKPFTSFSERELMLPR